MYSLSLLMVRLVVINTDSPEILILHVFIPFNITYIYSFFYEVTVISVDKVLM